MKKNRLKDITWGGRVRTEWKSKVMEIGRKAKISESKSFSGGMVSSSETYGYSFLDGGIVQSSGYFDSSCGSFISGDKAKAYVIYKLGFNARQVLKDFKLPTLAELEEELNKQKMES